LALHSINIGLIGSIIIAMISRVSLGHTGRAIKATKLMIASYILIQLTALIRLIFGQLPSMSYLDSVKLSGLFWALAFMCLFISLIPILTKPRTDGRIG
ncbi:MAG: NnrS family protein, partial [Bdellovibrionales bacterium]|nr:NnrS family protein [Bdellovibrionales bacterium]